MEMPYFVKELLELSLIMRAKRHWAEEEMVKQSGFWQPWLDKGILDNVALYLNFDC